MSMKKVAKLLSSQFVDRHDLAPDFWSDFSGCDVVELHAKKLADNGRVDDSHRHLALTWLALAHGLLFTEKAMDDVLNAMFAAWAEEEFEYRQYERSLEPYDEFEFSLSQL